MNSSQSKHFLNAQREVDLQGSIDAQLRARGAVWSVHIPAAAYSGRVLCPHCRKWHTSPARIPAGIPDTLAVFKGGRQDHSPSGLFVAIEAKKEKGKLTDEQNVLWSALGDSPEFWSRLLRPSGFDNFVHDLASWCFEHQSR